MDNYYFLVRVSNSQKIELYCFDKIMTYNYPICFSGSNMNTVLYLLSLHNIIKSISIIHALYLGKELSKAEIVLFTDQRYIQE
uniref:DUF4346 domain-containing protein n=2 Tax=Membranoptera TaxID=158697 RepID=A0A1L1YA40_9FLOR|nr:hypothetical protein [Membranoptera weeksiae]YP_009332961.1 hypothetical protein [Membranoptera tenuis]AHZ94755.1 hypothetical protein [Membranoptera weeksiae]AKL79217.1 hypothetical protein [Membranoptera tenuis]